MSRRKRRTDFPVNRKTQRPGISLADELDTISNAMEATAVLVELAPLDHSHEATAERHSRLVSALIALTGDRVKLLRRVIVGTLDATMLIARHNTRDETPDAAEDNDVLLQSRKR